MSSLLHRPFVALCLLALAGCAQLQPRLPVAGAAPETAGAGPAPASAVEPAPAAPPISIVALAARPAEQALLAGLRAYEDGDYKRAEERLAGALRAGLEAPQDRAAAHKTLAFVYCTSKRIRQCEAAFRAARSADPEFALSKAEAGHPTWGRVYRRIGPPPSATAATAGPTAGRTAGARAAH